MKEIKYFINKILWDKVKSFLNVTIDEEAEKDIKEILTKGDKDESIKDSYSKGKGKVSE